MSVKGRLINEGCGNCQFSHLTSPHDLFLSKKKKKSQTKQTSCLLLLIKAIVFASRDQH